MDLLSWVAKNLYVWFFHVVKPVCTFSMLQKLYVFLSRLPNLYVCFSIFPNLYVCFVHVATPVCMFFPCCQTCMYFFHVAKPVCMLFFLCFQTCMYVLSRMPKLYVCFVHVA